MLYKLKLLQERKFGMMKVKILGVLVVCLAGAGILFTLNDNTDVPQKMSVKLIDVDLDSELKDTIKLAEQVKLTVKNEASGVDVTQSKKMSAKAEVIIPLDELLSDSRNPVESYFESISFNKPTVEELDDPDKLIAFEYREQRNLLKQFVSIVEKEISAFKSTLKQSSETENVTLITQAEIRLSQLELIQSDLENELSELKILELSLNI